MICHCLPVSHSTPGTHGGTQTRTSQLVPARRTRASARVDEVGLEYVHVPGNGGSNSFREGHIPWRRHRGPSLRQWPPAPARAAHTRTASCVLAEALQQRRRTRAHAAAGQTTNARAGSGAGLPAQEFAEGRCDVRIVPARGGATRGGSASAAAAIRLLREAAAAAALLTTKGLRYHSRCLCPNPPPPRTAVTRRVVAERASSSSWAPREPSVN